MSDTDFPNQFSELTIESILDTQSPPQRKQLTSDDDLKPTMFDSGLGDKEVLIQPTPQNTANEDSRPFDRPGDQKTSNAVVSFSDTPTLDDPLTYFATFKFCILTANNSIEVQDIVETLD